MATFLRYVIAAAALVAVCSGIAFYLAYRVFGAHTVKHYGHDQQWTECPKCSAGTQFWVNGHWGKVPKEWSLIQKDGSGGGHFQAGVANTRKCLHCGTNGGWWHDRKEKRNVAPDRKSA